jgi:hypothetical protein
MRVFRIAIGYLAAAYCAGLIFLALIMIQDPFPNHAIGLLPYFAAYGTLFAIPLTILQSALLVILSERLRIRSLSLYLIAGLITGATASSILTPAGPLPATRNDWLLSLFLGLNGTVCAFVYWAIAGRKAGLPAQPRGHWISYLPCLFAGIVLSAALTGFETFKLHGGLFSGLYAGSLSYCFLVHAALGAYFACALFEGRPAAAAP